MTFRRLIRGLAVAPLVAPAVFMAIHLFGGDGLKALLAYGFIVAIYSYGAALFLGLPVVAWFGHRRVTSARAYAIAGTAIGGFMPIFLSSKDDLTMNALGVVTCLVAGCLSALAFRSVACVGA